MTPIEITLFVYTLGTVAILAIGLSVMVSDEKLGARMVLTCWAWPIWAVLMLWHLINVLLEAADWKRP